jgi:hypothetical protein
VSSDDDLFHVGKESSVVEVLDNLVQHSVRAGVLRGVWVLIAPSGRPLRSRPDQTVGGRAATRLEAVSPGVAIVLIISIREVGRHDGDIIKINVRIRRDLSQCR